MLKKVWVVIFLFSLILSCASCGTIAGTENGVYSKYNIHYFKKGRTAVASCENFTECPGHSFLPYNSKITAESWKRGLRFVDVKTGKEILFEYKGEVMGGMSKEEYVRLITSTAPVSYEGLSDKDKEGIAAGKAMVGMTKQGVMIALGYPAKIKTLSTDQNTWIYWKGRMTNLVVEFDDNGNVKSAK